MFDIGATELLLIVIVAVIVIGPKELPLALRTAGRWIGKARRVSGHFRSGIETMIREAEMEEMDRKWRERNEAIMAEHPTAEFHPEEQMQASQGAGRAEAPPASAAEAKALYGETSPAPETSAAGKPSAPGDAVKTD